MIISLVTRMSISDDTVTNSNKNPWHRCLNTTGMGRASRALMEGVKSCVPPLNIGCTNLTIDIGGASRTNAIAMT